MKPEKQHMMSFRIPESVHRRLREWAGKRGLKIQHVVTEAIREKVERPEEGRS